MNLKNWGIRMKVLLYGYGLMGKKVAHQLREKDEFDLIGVVSYEFDEKAPEAMYSNLTEVQDRADVIIDFSHPNNLDDILAYAKKNKTKVVFATTGFSKEQLDKIEEASKEIAIFQSYNTSFGIQMVTKILRQVAKEFYDNGYDIEILEKHHNQKIDAPSGTAKLLYEVMEDEIKETTPVYDRSALHEKRKKQEIPIYFSAAKTVAPNAITAAKERTRLRFQFFLLVRPPVLLVSFFLSSVLSSVSNVSSILSSTHFGTVVSSEKISNSLSSMNVPSFILCAKLLSCT